MKTRKKKDKRVSLGEPPILREVRLNLLKNYFRVRGYKISHVELLNGDLRVRFEQAGPYGLRMLSLSRRAILEINSAKIFRLSDQGKGTGQCVFDVTDRKE